MTADRVVFSSQECLFDLTGIADSRSGVHREREPRIAVHRTQHNVRAVEQQQRTTRIEEYETAAVFFELFELVPTLIYLLADRCVGIELPKADEGFLWRIKVLHVCDDGLVFPLDCVIRSLSLARMFFLEVEGNALKVQVILENYLTLRARRFSHSQWYPRDRMEIHRRHE